MKCLERLPVFAARIVSSPLAFLASVAATASGFAFGWSEAWWVTADRAAWLLTLWLVFLLQGAQTRDTKAIQVKLDAVLRQLPGSNRAVDIENATEKEIDQLKREA